MQSCASTYWPSSYSRSVAAPVSTKRYTKRSLQRLFGWDIFGRTNAQRIRVRPTVQVVSTSFEDEGCRGTAAGLFECSLFPGPPVLGAGVQSQGQALKVRQNAANKISKQIFLKFFPMLSCLNFMDSQNAWTKPCSWDWFYELGVSSTQVIDVENVFRLWSCRAAFMVSSFPKPWRKMFGQRKQLFQFGVHELGATRVNNQRNQYAKTNHHLCVTNTVVFYSVFFKCYATVLDLARFQRSEVVPSNLLSFWCSSLIWAFASSPKDSQSFSRRNLNQTALAWKGLRPTSHPFTLDMDV